MFCVSGGCPLDTNFSLAAQACWPRGLHIMDALCRQPPTVQEEVSHLKMFLVGRQSSALREQAGSLFLLPPGRAFVDVQGQAGWTQWAGGPPNTWAVASLDGAVFLQDGLGFELEQLRDFPRNCRAVCLQLDSWVTEMSPAAYTEPLEPPLTALPVTSVTLSSDSPWCPPAARVLGGGAPVFQAREPSLRQGSNLLVAARQVGGRDLKGNMGLSQSMSRAARFTPICSVFPCVWDYFSQMVILSFSLKKTMH